MEQDNLKIFGLRAIIEAVHAGKTIEKIYLQKEVKGELVQELNQLIKEHKISFSYVPVEKLNKLSKSNAQQKQNHQGAVAKISSIGFSDLDTVLTQLKDQNTTPLLLLLDQISDVRNLGAILRTAECTGVDAVIIPTHGSAPINADAIKTSAGAAFNLKICKVNHLLDAVYQIQAFDIQLVGITEKTKQNLYDIDLKKPTAIILGSEHKGISKGVLNMVDAKGSIPLLGEIDSLNVSVACGVALYESIRQRMI